jgi:hypothetical protein
MDPRASGGVHITRGIPWEMPASPAVGATLALRLITLLVYPYAA